MTHRDAGRDLARPRSIPPEHRKAAGCGGWEAAVSAAVRRTVPHLSAPHVKRAHRAVFARFALSLRAAIRRRAGKEGVTA